MKFVSYSFIGPSQDVCLLSASVTKSEKFHSIDTCFIMSFAIDANASDWFKSWNWNVKEVLIRTKLLPFSLVFENFKIFSIFLQKWTVRTIFYSILSTDSKMAPSFFVLFEGQNLSFTNIVKRTHFTVNKTAMSWLHTYQNKKIDCLKMLCASY